VSDKVVIYDTERKKKDFCVFGLHRKKTVQMNFTTKYHQSYGRTIFAQPLNRYPGLIPFQANFHKTGKSI